MVGAHATAILADAAIKGVAGVDVTAAAAAAINAVDAQANSSHYDQLGYVPIETDESAAGLTLAYAFDDGVTATLAALAGRHADSTRLRARSHNWENVMNGSQPYPCPRNASGGWMCSEVDRLLIYPFEKHFAEGDGEEYRFFVNHEPDRLVQRFGQGGASSNASSNANESFAGALEAYFNNTPGWLFGNALPNPYEWIGNEPTLAHPFLFPFAGNAYAWLTQKWARWVAQTYFSPDPDGLPGNDDFGAISGYYTFAAFGFYPFTGTGLYSLSSPLFDNITIALPPHEALIFHGIDPTLWPEATALHASIPVLSVSAPPISNTSSPYVAGACANGQSIPNALLAHNDLFRPAREHIQRAFAQKDTDALLATTPATINFQRTPHPTTWTSIKC
jgi:putative alpha-1,2-mannosidase